MDTNYAPRSRQTRFSTSRGGLAVYPLWKGGVQDALKEFGSVREHLSRKLGVAAVLPDQPLDLNEMDALEEAGLLVIEVPQKMREVQAETLAAFVEEQVDGVEPDVPCVVAELMATPEADSEPLSSADEDALLRSINDPDADEGST